jgi:hypothetical protein
MIAAELAKIMRVQLATDIRNKYHETQIDKRIG